jgi:DNA-binding transcriptional LysR family regulator
VETLFAAEVFDSATAEENYRIATTDYPLLLFFPQAAREINNLSPHSTLRVEPYRDEVFDDMQHETLDLTFYGAAPPAAFRHEVLFEDRCVCVMAADHALAKRKRLTLDEYLRCSHLMIDIIDGRQPVIDNRLRERDDPAIAVVRAPVELEPMEYFMVWLHASTTIPPNSGCETRFVPSSRQLSERRWAGTDSFAAARSLL